MNEDLYRALVDLGVFPEPAEDLAHLYDGGEHLTRKVLTAFLAHVRETDNIAIAVWRLRHRILTTGSQRIDLIHLAERRSTGYSKEGTSWAANAAKLRVI